MNASYFFSGRTHWISTTIIVHCVLFHSTSQMNGGEYEEGALCAPWVDSMRLNFAVRRTCEIARTIMNASYPAYPKSNDASLHAVFALFGLTHASSRTCTIRYRVYMSLVTLYAHMRKNSRKWNENDKNDQKWRFISFCNFLDSGVAGSPSTFGQYQ